MELIIGVCDFLALYLNVLFAIILTKNNFAFNRVHLNSVLIINVILKYLLSYLVLKSNFYRHHYLSFFINIIFLILLGVLDSIEIYQNENSKIIIFYTIMKILTVLFYSI